MTDIETILFILFAPIVFGLCALVHGIWFVIHGGEYPFWWPNK